MRRILAGLAALFVLTNVQAITIKIDYTYDTSNFFAAQNPSDNSTLARATVEQAAKDLGDALTAEANASLNLVPTSHFKSGNELATLDWEISFRNPSTPPPADSADLSNQITLSDFSYLADTFTVYAGASALVGSTELGEGAPISVQSTLGYDGAEEQSVDSVQDVVALSNGFMGRGSGPTVYLTPDSVDVGATHIDYTLNVGPVGGFLSLTSGTAWHFDYHTLPAMGEFDLYTVVLHEMMHALGFGSSVTWASKRAVNNTDWSGSHVIALRGGSGNGVLDGAPESAHIAVTEMSTTVATTAGVNAGTPQEAVMAPTLTPGTRRTLTHLDLAFLQDLGYGPAAPAPTPSTTPIPTPTPATPTPTPVPQPPEPPALKGKAPKRTDLAKVTLTGTLISPGAYVVYKIGKGKFIKAKGSDSAWKAVIKLKPGKNIIYIASFNPATGETSKLKKIVITRE